MTTNDSYSINQNHTTSPALNFEPDSSTPHGKINYSRWMTDIGANLEHLKIHEVIMVEAHNSGVDKKGAKGWLADDWAACQDDSFSYQLRHGVRALDLRCYQKKSETATHKEWRFEHSSHHANRYLNDCIRGVLEFAETNPGEIVILDFHVMDVANTDKQRLANYINIVLGKRCIPANASQLTIGQIRRRFPGKNVIIAWDYNTSVYWPKLRRTWTGEDFNNPAKLKRHILATLADPPTNRLWSVFAAGYRWGPTRFGPRAIHWDAFFNNLGPDRFRQPCKGNMINVDFVAGTGTVDRCINASQLRADSARASLANQLVASNITTHSIHLDWQPPIDNEPVAGYKLFANERYVATTSGTQYAFTGLKDGTNYHLQVVASFASGDGAMAEVSARTIGLPDTTKPSKPSDLKFIFLGGGTAYLAWTAATDNVGVTRYDIYANNSLIGSAGPQYPIYPINAGDFYAYSVRALDAAGNYADSDPCVMSEDKVPPGKPGNFRVETATDHSVTLEWDASDDNVGVIGYQIYRNNTLIDEVTSTFFIDKGLAAATYGYKIRALDAAGNFADSAPLTFTIHETPPSKPSGLRAVSIGQKTYLAWDTPQQEAGIHQYEIYRNNVRLGAVAHDPQGPFQAFITEDLITPWTFLVRASDFAGKSTDSDLLTGP